MEKHLITVLDDCLAAIQGGETIDNCLARYPDVADELSSLLWVALALEKLPQPGPSESTSQTAKTHFLSEARRRRLPPQGVIGGFRAAMAAARSRTTARLSIPAWTTPLRSAATAALALAFVLLLGSGVIYAASGSLPGDPLYGFKLLGEDVQRAFTLNSTNRHQLEEEFSTRRLNEVRQLLTLERQEQVAFGGLLQRQNEASWWIENIPVTLNPDTRVQAEPTANSLVEIHGITRADGTVLALLVEIKGRKIIGRIEAINPGRWQIAGKYFNVDGKTYVQRRLQVGDCVEVHARHFSDGSRLAQEIERTDTCQDSPGQQERDFDDETPTPTPTPTSTPTRSPTATPSPTPEPESDDDDQNAIPTIEVLPDPTYPPAAPLPPPAAESDDDRDEDDGQERGSDQDDDDDAGQDDEDGGDPQEDDDGDQDDDDDAGQDDEDDGDQQEDDDGDQDGDGDDDNSGDDGGDPDGDGDDDDSGDGDSDEDDHDDEDKGDHKPGD